MNLISFATFMLATGINLQAAYGAEAKQHVRKLQSNETGEQVEEDLEKEVEDLLDWKWGDWGEKPKPTATPPQPPQATCPLLGGTTLESSEEICLILPNGIVPGGVSGEPQGASAGIFCAGTGNPYKLTITDVTPGPSQKLLRANLDLPDFVQNPGVAGRKLEGEGKLPPIVVQALTGDTAPSGDIAMIQGGAAPSNIDFQGFWDEGECSFNLVSTQGGHLIGKFNGSDFTIEFTQTGQVTSLLSSLGSNSNMNNPTPNPFEGAIGTITLDFAFAFKGDFDEL